MAAWMATAGQRALVVRTRHQGRRALILAHVRWYKSTAESWKGMPLAKLEWQLRAGSGNWAQQRCRWMPSCGLCCCSASMARGRASWQLHGSLSNVC